jgi:hypothetical protein
LTIILPEYRTVIKIIFSHKVFASNVFSQNNTSEKYTGTATNIFLGKTDIKVNNVRIGKKFIIYNTGACHSQVVIKTVQDNDAE